MTRFCPETGKECYATKGEARAAARGMSAGRGRNKPTKAETYECEHCGWQHLTNAQSRPTLARKEQRKARRP